MSLATDLRADPAGALDTLRAAVERGASVLAGANRAAGPATPQDDTADLIPAPDALGMSVALDGGLTVVVLLTPDLAEELIGSRDAAAVPTTLAPVAEEIGAALGAAGGPAIAVGSPAELDALLAGTELLVASGVFAADAVVATVAVAMGPADAPGAAGPAGSASPDETPSAAPPVSPPPSAAPAGPTAHGAPPHGAATAVPPRSATSAAATADAPPAPFIGDAALTRGLSILAEVSLEVTAELGRAALRVSELLDLQPGSIIELDREAGAPVELFVNGTLFARAEVVVVDGQYAVRICELFGGEAPR